jgi:RNA polymerase sigma-70 factor (ECF subfamily)
LISPHPRVYITDDAIRNGGGEQVSIRQGVLTAGEIDGQAGTEAALLQAAQAGDHAALEALFAPYERPLLALCRGILGHAEDAEDAVQETYLRALRALPRFRGDAAVRTWLFRIAVNLCLNWKRDRRATEPWDEEHLPSEAPAPDTMALHRLQVTEALDRLPRRHRVIFLLKVLEGWSVAEIGTMLGWNRIRVQNELSKARRALAEWRRSSEEGDER